jgi:ABC-type branched-subunit amino acid transport system ATPase component/ABC-type branched-subunit amino acid transport system permease subunit
MRLLAAAAFAVVFAGAIAACLWAGSYEVFVLGTMAQTAIVGIGLNVLLGLSGQVSLGHAGFYAIGAYTVAILAGAGVSFWLALPLAIVLSAVVGALLAIPALRVRGPYLAMVTIAFGFIVEQGAVEWRGLTGGANGLMGYPQPVLFGVTLGEREAALMSVFACALATFLYWRLAEGRWGDALRAVRDSETAAAGSAIEVVHVRTMAFVISAAAGGLAGALFAPLTGFVSPSAFPFFLSILFLLAVIVGGAGSLAGPLVGAAIVVALPELLAFLAEYRLLFYGGFLLFVLWLAPSGVIGTVAKLLPRPRSQRAARGDFDLASFLGDNHPAPLRVESLTIAFGGVRAATDVGFTAAPGRITSVIGPNGAGKTTVLNLLAGFYRPQAGRILLGDEPLPAGKAASIARAGIARTYQTPLLFTGISALGNVRVALRRGRLGVPFAGTPHAAGERRLAESLLAFVGYAGELDRPADALPHVDRRLVEIARALALRPRVLLLDEPAAGLSAEDKERLAVLLEEVAKSGVAVVLVEHDMSLVMRVSAHVVVLDAGMKIAEGTPEAVQNDPAVLKAYLGESGSLELERQAIPERAAAAPVLAVSSLEIGYGAAPVLHDASLDVREGELVAVLGPNGAGKTTLLRTIVGLHRASSGTILWRGATAERWPAHRAVRAGLILVPEGRQVFPELSVLDNIRLGGFARSGDVEPEIEAALALFPRLRERLHQPAGLLSGGEQQMLAIARGLLSAPRLLMLDEPSLGLAPLLVRDVFKTLAELRERGTTLLVVDQMANYALALADRAYVIDAGHMRAAGTENPELVKAYLGTSAA